MMKRIIAKLKDRGIKSEKIKADADMASYTSFRAGGRADVLVEPADEEELVCVLKVCSEEGVPYMVMGNGSDVLVRDGGYRGVIIRMGEAFSHAEICGDMLVTGSGLLMSQAARAALEAELAGFEFAAGIPGSIGGGVFMNAGAYGGELAQIIEYADVIDIKTFEKKRLTAEELEMSYRHSILEETGDIVTAAAFRLEKGSREEISAVMKDLAARRNEKQPLSYPSAGSFFKRPEGHFAGKLIEDAGLKGLSYGGARVSEKHAGFIINTGNAKASDIISLMRLVQNTVYDTYGVKLEPEVRIMGED